MTDENLNKEAALNIALKEWSATIDALTSGDQIFLLRKGGIRETNRHFELANRRFLLYPTHFHEANSMLKPEFRHLIGPQIQAHPDSVVFKAWAEVVDVLSIDQVEGLNTLSDFHVWTDGFVAKRIAWKPRHAASLILLKTHVLPKPVRIPVEPHHKGCKSWVDIEPAIDISCSAPALLRSNWDEQAREIRLMLSDAHVKLVSTA